jgi:hypothetical protein
MMDELHLLFAHAGAQLIDHFLGDDIALLHVDLIDTGETASAG